MTDKTRQRNRLLKAPHGTLPNWLLAVLAVGIVSVGVLLTRVA